MAENNRLIADVKALEAAADLPIPGAGDAGKVVTVNPGHTGYQLDAKGTGATAGAVRIIALPIAFNTPNLLTGVPMWTPAVGDLLVGINMRVATAWDGTTPGVTFTQGALPVADMAPIALAADYVDTEGNALVALGAAAFTPGQVMVRMATTTPVSVRVVQQGDGVSDPESTVGAGIAYLSVCTPDTA